MGSRQGVKEMNCSFCGYYDDYMVQGPGVIICRGCVGEALAILIEDGPRPMSCFGCGRTPNFYNYCVHWPHFVLCYDCMANQIEAGYIFRQVGFDDLPYDTPYEWLMEF